MLVNVELLDVDTMRLPFFGRMITRPMTRSVRDSQSIHIFEVYRAAKRGGRNVEE